MATANNLGLSISENGVAFIKGWEGLTTVPKRDIGGGRWMWGYGHDQEPGEGLPASVNANDADAILRTDLAAWVEPAVRRLAPQANQNQFDALSDFCYNEGPAHLATMLSHGFDQVPAQMPRWVYAVVNHVETELDDLKQRRAAEVALFNS